ncbi:hypothetical protein JCM10207_005296 [Rhodosporidiobolus poonsookiae]
MALHLPAHSLSDEIPSNILRLSLNSNGCLFATATLEGWAVYATNPLQTRLLRDLPNASLNFVLPLEQSNIVFLVGGPPSPLYPPNKVVLWDCQTGSAAAELEFREDVRGITARRDRLVVVLRRRVVVYVLGRGGEGVWREGEWQTTENPKGLVALATAPGSTLLAFPGRQPGQAQLVRLPPLDAEHPPLPPPPSHDPTSAPYPAVSIILAHESALSALATTPSGSLLATSSSKGTLVRVWDPTTSYLMKELRRGTDTAEIFGISLRSDGGAVAVSSDKGTVHVWDLKREKKDEARAGGSDSGSSTPRGAKQFSLLKPYLPKYFSSTWSHSQFRLPPPPAPPASRLPFTLANPGPIPPNPLAPPPPSGERRAPSTVEDDVCICTWVDVEVEVEIEGDGPDGANDLPASGRATPTASSSSRRYPSSSSGSTSSRPAPAPSAYPSFPLPSSRASIPRASTPSTSSASRPTPRRPPRTITRTEAQLIALTHSGGWFRIAFDPSAVANPSAASSSSSASAKGKERARDEPPAGGGRRPVGEQEVRLGRDSTSDCRLVEYRRFGQKDEW